MNGEAINWSGHVEEDTQNFAMMAYSSSNSGSDNEGITYLVDLIDFDSSVETTTSVPAPVDKAPKVVSETKVRTDAPIIEEYESESDDDSVSNVQKNIEKPSFAFTNSVKHAKSPRENVKETGTPNHYLKIEKQDRHSHTRKGLGYAVTRKSCFVCGSFSHIIRDCDFHEKRMAKQTALTKSKEKAQRTTFSYHKVNTINTSLSAVKGNGDTDVKASTNAKWLMRMFPLPQDLMIKYFYLLHGCPLERATLCWNTLTYEAKTGAYNFQQNETRFVLDANLLRDALEITPIDQAHQFGSPPSGDAIMDFVNQLGYTEVIHFVSRMAVSNLYQPWRAILSMINQCLTGKTFGHDRPKYPVLQMLWGIIMSTNVDYAELLWEEFVQAIQTFLTDKANLGSPTKKGRKDKPHVILFYLRLGNLKFVPKGEVDEVFGMTIPNELISNNIRNEGTKKTASAKQPKPMPAIEKSTKPTPAPKLKATKERLSKASTAKPPKPKPAKEKSTKTTPPQKSEPEPKLEHQGKGDKDDMELAIQMKATQPLPVVEGKGKAIVTEEQHAHSPLALYTPKKRSTMDQFIFQRRTPAIEAYSTGPSAQAQDDTCANIICDSPSLADAKICAASEKTNNESDTEILQINEEQEKDVDEQVNLKEKTDELDQGQARSDPGRTLESRPSPEQVVLDEDQAGLDPGESHRALAGPDPEPTHDEFMNDLYPKVQESLKFPADEHVILEDPISSTRTLSSMKNLEYAYVIGDQFISDKSTKDEPEKPNVEAKMVSMVTVLIYLASSSVPLLFTPIIVIDLLPPKPASSTTQAPIFTATTTTTKTTLPPPPQQQSTTESELAARVTLLEKKLSDLEQKNKTLDNTSQNLGSRVFNLEIRDLPHKIDEVVRESVGEYVHVALQAPLRDRFRELPEADMKELLHQRMFETGTYKSLSEHVALYEALEASMECANRSHKRRCDDQDPPPPLPAHPRAPQPSPWKKSDTRDAPPSSSKQQSDPHAEQPMGKTELTQADFEGQAYEVVKAFYPNIVHLQFQMKECHKMLTDQIDWANPEGDQVRTDISKPLPLSGPPVPLMVYLIGGLIVKNSTLTDTLLTQAASDGTLTNIMEALDYRVKKYKVNRLNPDSRPEGSSKTWNALLVVEYEILTTDSFREPNEHIISAYRVIPKYHSEDENPARANIKQVLGRELPKAMECLKKEFEMKDLEKTKFCLGLKIELLNDKILVHQEAYTKEVLKRFYMDKSHSLSTPNGDAGHRCDPHIGQSQIGYVFTYDGTAISWCSIKQTITATSSNREEILAIHKSSRECV
nr:retrovirus-related Pol polyprotein from transposon TNT 1-94 [Tanacetum cinerariifolium]